MLSEGIVVVLEGSVQRVPSDSPGSPLIPDQVVHLVVILGLILIPIWMLSRSKARQKRSAQG